MQGHVGEIRISDGRYYKYKATITAGYRDGESARLAPSSYLFGRTPRGNGSTALMRRQNRR